MNRATTRETGKAGRLVLAAAACVACHAAWAQQAELTMASMDTAALVPLSEALPRVEVTRSALPRLESPDGPMGGQRLDLTVLPPRRSLGLALGVNNFQPQQPLPGQQPQQTNLDVGLTWRHTTDSNYQVDFTAWRRMSPQPDAWSLVQQRQTPTYVARVEFNLGAGSRSGLVADKGFLGVQLENGARIALKRKDGGAMVYYRKKF